MIQPVLPATDRLISVLLFCYVTSVLLFPEVPVLSRSSLVFAMGLGFVLILRYVRWGELLLSDWMILPFLFLLYALASVWWAVHPGSALLSVFILFSGAIGGLLVWAALLNSSSWQVVVAACFWSGVVIMISTLPEMAAGGSNMRLAGILGNPNALAIHLTTAAFLMLAAQKWQKSYTAAAMFFVLFATVTSGSIKMLLFWAIFLTYIAVRMHVWAKRSYLRLALLTCVYLILLLIPLLVGGLLWENVEELTVTKRFLALLVGENTSGTTRLAMIQEALAVWARHPIIGSGIDQFRIVGSYGTYSHNNYTEMLANFGLAGTTLFYLTDLALFWVCLPKIFRDSRYFLVLLMLIISVLWDFALVSYMEKSAWLILAASFYLVHQAKAAEETRHNLEDDRKPNHVGRLFGRKRSQPHV